MKEEQWRPVTQPIIQEVPVSSLGKIPLSPNDERPKMSTLERERLEAKLVALGKLMNDSGVWWQLDGALNLSLRQKAAGGDYIGVHSDIDISVLRDELVTLQEYLIRNGYGFFLQSKDGDNRILRRVGSTVFSHQRRQDIVEAPVVVAIDESGNVRTADEITRMQISIIDIDSDGNPIQRGLSYPREWLEGSTVDIGDSQITMSHPARHLLTKLWYMRNYDETDIKLWSEMQVLSFEDLNKLENIIETAVTNPNWTGFGQSNKANIEVLRRRLNYFRDTKTS